MNIYPTVDKTNEAFDLIKGRIEKLEDDIKSLKIMIASFEGTERF